MSDTPDETLAMNPHEAVRALERFISENDELYELEERVGKFNVFDALRVDRAEIRHSNFLAWLLDPSESHGLGEMFLRALLMDLFRDAPVDRRPCSPVDLDGATFTGVDVRREWMNIDLLIRVEDPKCLLLIENKIGSGEHSGQLRRYKEIASRHFPDFACKTALVFLTVDGDEPSDDEWLTCSYADIHRVFSRVRRLGSGVIGEDVRVFLEHYLSLIGNRFMDNQTIDDLCRKIYKSHRVALDLIFERVSSTGSNYVRIVEEVLEKNKDEWVHVNSTTRLVQFIPRAWESVLPPIGTRPTFDPRYWVMLNFHVSPKRFTRRSGATPTSDQDLRAAILTTLCEDHDFGFKLRSRDSLQKRWIGLGRELVLRLDGEPPTDEQIRESVEKKLRSLKKKLDGSADVIRKAAEQHAKNRG